MRRVLLFVVVAVAAVIAVTVWVGARVREDTVVADPYQEGLKLTVAHRQARPATAPQGAGAESALDLVLSPAPPRTMKPLAVEVTVAGPPADEVTVSFAMDGMAMGNNTVRLAAGEGGRYRGQAVLVRCPSGRRDWIATVRARRGSAVVERAVPFQVEE